MQTAAGGPAAIELQHPEPNLQLGPPDAVPTLQVQIDATAAATKLQSIWRGYTARRDVRRARSQDPTATPKRFLLHLNFLRYKKSLFRIKDLQHEIALTNSYRQLPVNPYFFFLLKRHYLPKSLQLSSRKRYVLWHFLRWNVAALVLAYGIIICALPMVFLLPTWVVLLLQLLYNDNEGHLDFSQVVAWVLLYSVIITVLLSVATIILTVTQEKFGRRLSNHITLICTKYSKLINVREVELLRQFDVSNVKVILFRLIPTVVAFTLLLISCLVMLFQHCWQMGLGGVMHMVVIVGYSLLYERYVLQHMKTVQMIAKEEVQNWSALAPHTNGQVSKDLALDRAFALNQLMMSTNLKSARMHVLVGIVFRLMMAVGLAVVFLLGLRLTQTFYITISEFLICLAYYVFGLVCIYMIHVSLVEAIKHRVSWIRLMEMAWQARYLPSKMVSSRYFDSLLDPEADESSHQNAELARQRHYAATHFDVKSNLTEAQYGMYKPKMHISVGLVVSSLLLICGICTFIAVYIKMIGVEFECVDITAECAAVSAAQDPLVVHLIVLQQAFSFSEGCMIRAPLRNILNVCASLVWSTAQLGTVNNTFTINPYQAVSIRVQYKTWRGMMRGVTTRYHVTAAGLDLKDQKLCPLGEPVIYYHDQEMMALTTGRTYNPVWGNVTEAERCATGLEGKIPGY